MADLNISVSVRDLAEDDLGWCGWAGSSTHLSYVRHALIRASRSEVAYLAVCPPSDLPVAIGGVDFTATPEVGTLWQNAEAPDGSTIRHRTACTVMRKDL